MRFASLLIVCILAVVVRSEERPLKMGDQVGNLTFKDIHFLQRSLKDLGERKAYVLVFSTTSCPLVQRYWPTLNRLEKEYRDRGVQFVALNVGPDDAISAMATQAVVHDCAFPFVKDQDAACAAILGVKRTPEVVVLDGQKRLRYRGRIDDQYRLGGARPAPTRHDLKEAIEAVLGSKEVAVSETPVDGCLITRAEPAPARTPVSYAEHVAPLLRKHCVECHSPGTAAPFALTSYEHVAAKANTIAEAVADQRMPPWYGAPEHTEFINRRGMTANERETIRQWVRGGKQRGDEGKLPPLVLPKPDAWRIGEPDLVLNAPEHDIPAEGLVEYKYVPLPHAFTHDSWVQGVQIRPDNPRVLHHCNMAWVSLGEGFKINNFITGTVPGGEPMTLGKGVGYRIPKGAFLVLQVHYVTTGKPEKCRISVGFKYATGTIDRQLRFKYLVDTKYTIPPGAPAHRVSASRVLEHEAEGVGLFCHMHLRGRDMTFKAHYPDGKSETLLVIPNYNFDWQMPYRWAPGAKKLPKGTRLECIAHYDNSTFNPFNPDPKATVRDGQQTHQEMLNGFVFYTDREEKLNLEMGKEGEPKSRR